MLVPTVVDVPVELDVLDVFAVWAWPDLVDEVLVPHAVAKAANDATARMRTRTDLGLRTAAIG